MDLRLTAPDSDGEWDALVAASPQGHVFSESRYLRALGAPYKCFVARTPGGEPLAGTAIVEDGKSMHAAPYPFTPYQGIVFGETVSAEPSHTRVTSEYRLTEFFIENLLDLYGNVSMALSPSFADIRPFLWHNYHDASRPRFTIRNRYTALLDLSGFRPKEYVQSIRNLRRRELRKCTAEIKESDDLSLFLDLYVRTFERQGIEVSPQDRALVESIATSALRAGYGNLGMATTPEGVAAMSLFLHDSHCAYYLFGANDPELRKSGASTALMVHSIRNAAERGLSRLDFVGANSPNRGDYKLSFNASLRPYYEVVLEKNA